MKINIKKKSQKKKTKEKSQKFSKPVASGGIAVGIVETETCVESMWRKKCRRIPLYSANSAGLRTRSVYRRHATLIIQVGGARRLEN